MAVAAAALAAVGLPLGLFATPFDLFGRVPALTGTLSAAPADVAVVDGNTLRVSDTVVRLEGVAAPARGAACADGAGRRFDCGARAAEALAGLVRDHAVQCRLYGRDPAGLILGRCEAAGDDISRALVAAGWARAGSGIDTVSAGLDDAEAAARAAGRGLWRDGVQPSF